MFTLYEFIIVGYQQRSFFVFMDKILCQPRWNEIAWNGISFYKPATWEIGTIGRNYLMICTHEHPRMEITWGISGHPASRQPDIKKLQSRIYKQHLSAVDPWKPSTAWLDALSSYETSGFSWKRFETICFGVIITCLACRRVSIIQFFQHADEPAPIHDFAPKVLSSFIDHTNGSDQLWAVFDIRATLPTEFQVKTYRFSPGYMEMVFLSHGRHICFYRWSPASVLLANRKLIDFAKSLHIYPNESFRNTADAYRIEWESIPSDAIWKRFTAFLLARYSYRRVLIRHDPATNRILAIKAESRYAMNSSHLDHIFSSYEISAP